MATIKVQVILEEEERAMIRREAEAAGTSLSAWVRRAALDKLEAARRARRLSSAEDLAAFFAACDERETGREPDWSEHLEVIDASRASGRGTS